MLQKHQKRNKYTVHATADSPGKNKKARVNPWLTRYLNNGISIIDTTKQIKNSGTTRFVIQ